MIWHATLGAAVFTLTAMVATPAAQKKGGGGANGTTLAAQKTIAICSVNDSTWRVSGVVNVWNAGAIAAENLEVIDTLETKVGSAEWSPVNYLSSDRYRNFLPGNGGAGSVFPLFVRNCSARSNHSQ